jgi:hypothetical protein
MLHCTAPCAPARTLATSRGVKDLEAGDWSVERGPQWSNGRSRTGGIIHLCGGNGDGDRHGA